MTRAEIEWLLAHGYQLEIPVLRFSSAEQESEGAAAPGGTDRPLCAPGE